jgi:hypothetical protein
LWVSGQPNNARPWNPAFVGSRILRRSASHRSRSPNESLPWRCSRSTRSRRSSRVRGSLPNSRCPYYIVAGAKLSVSKLMP